MYNNRHEYTLESEYGRLKLDRDPMGWDESETEIGRSEKTYGIFLTISNNLEFTGKAKDFIETNYQLYGVQAEVRLTKLIKHPKTDEWQLASGFPGYLDFTTRNIENNKLKIDFVQGGLRELLTSQMREKFEINRTTDVKGRSISQLKTDKLNIEGRDIYLLSKFDSEEVTEFTINSGGWSGGFRPAYKPAPLTIIANSDTQNIGTPVDMIGDRGQHMQESAGTKFYVVADRDRGKVKLNINLSFTIKGIDTAFNPTDRDLKIKLIRFKDGEDFTFVEDWDIINAGDPLNNTGQTFSTPPGGFELELSGVGKVREGQSFGLYFYTNADYNTVNPGDDSFMNVDIEGYSASLSWSEDSFFDRTTSNFMRAFDVGERLTEIYSGKPAFKSTLLDSGKWKELGFSCGFWLRNMKKQVNEDGKTEERTLTINFDDFYKSIHAIEPVGYGIITEGNKQYIALEPLKYFFQPKTTIKLGKVSNIKRETAPEFIFSSISTGYTKGGNYEKPLGLDEYNIQSNYITPVTRVDTKYEVLGPSRADSYAVEQARRMQAEDYPEEDTPYDKDNFLIDAKEILRTTEKTTYEVRKWQDDFESAPTGIYSPETAFNLRLSPVRNLLRHAYWMNAATVKYPTDKLRYASSEGNSELETQLIGEDPVKENEDVLISDLSNPIFEPEWVEFEVPFTQEVMDQLTGQTKIGDEFINNYYGLMEFINESGQKEKAYLFTAKINKTITIKALKAYGF